jgi:hypothetical protein
MEELMVLTYVAICYAVFKIFRIPVNRAGLKNLNRMISGASA